MIALFTALCFTTAIAAMCALDSYRVRRELRQIKQDAAEQVANALGSSVLVDGIELPKPDDDRWRSLKYNDGNTRLKLGDIVSEENGYVFPASDVRSMNRTKATEKYCDAVWKAYRSRRSRKSIESAQ